MSASAPSPAVAAMLEQAGRCIAQIEAIAAANDRILARDPADPARVRLFRDHYNAVCRACAERPGTGAVDGEISALRRDADLKTVCDGRWVLGEEIDILRQRLDRIDPVPAPYDDFERLVRRSVTAPDRSPEELAGALQMARQYAERAAQWQPPEAGGETLLARWRRRLENNPVIAALMLAFVAIAAILNVLPKGCIGGGD